MLTLTAVLTVKAGQEDEFERVMHVTVPKVREEPRQSRLRAEPFRPKIRAFSWSMKNTRTPRRWNRTAPNLKEMGIDLSDLLGRAAGADLLRQAAVAARRTHHGRLTDKYCIVGVGETSYSKRTPARRRAPWAPRRFATPCATPAWAPTR